MKKIILSALLSGFMIASFAQSEKYVKAMKEKVAAVDTTFVPDKLIELSASFERIGDAEKSQWLPYYYAALTQVTSAYIMSMDKQGMSNITDPMADKAEQLINKAEALSKDNSEIFVVKKMIATLRLMG